MSKKSKPNLTIDIDVIQLHQLYYNEVTEEIMNTANGDAYRTLTRTFLRSSSFGNKRLIRGKNETIMHVSKADQDNSVTMALDTISKASPAWPSSTRPLLEQIAGDIAEDGKSLSQR
ncbi:hypothetical protein Cantr_08366 [Candida viswanathii]|uniref:Uncharacterized protein n=1 Tax=Candida viswanathii TaxID=5486 RepID=A0A367Y388_9ASCO|nr:hypothetical protein Cantr_08366 [Candida viswanathii]